MDPLKKTSGHDWILLHWLTDERMLALGNEWFPAFPWAEKTVASCRAAAHEDVTKRIAELERLLVETESEQYHHYDFNGNRITKDQRLNLLKNELLDTKNWIGLGDPPPYKTVIEPRSVCDSKPLGEGENRGRRPSVYLDRALTYTVSVSLFKGKGYLKDSYKNEWLGLPVWSVQKDVRPVAIEVKTTIPSYSEITQQLRTYKAYLGDRVTMVVVCPDDSMKLPLEKQGFLFVKCDPPPTGPQQRLL